MSSYLKFRLSQDWRRFRRELRLIRAWTINYLDRHIWGKWRQLGIIRRLVIGWWGLCILMLLMLTSQIGRLSDSRMVDRPVAGGRYSEGYVGEIKTINPILPESAAASDVSRLVFSSLVRYNPKRQLEPDLATSWEVSADGKAYTFHLRHGVKWHDNVPFTAQDVAFTLAAIQNPDSRSPLAASWQGVSATIKDDFTIIFNLPNAYPPFLANTTVGILPRHMLETVEPSTLRAADFNQNPIGTGPFRVKSFSTSPREIILSANDSYYNGRPMLDEFAFLGYDNIASQIDAYAKRQIVAMSRVDASDLVKTTSLKNVRYYELNLPDETAVFFKTTQPQLADKAVRSALGQAIDRAGLITKVFDGRATALYNPILPGQLGYSPKYHQVAYDANAGSHALDAAGWIIGKDGIRTKDGKKLSLKLVTSSGGMYPEAAEFVKYSWMKLGVEVTVTLANKTALQQTYIRPRNYDVLLFGINLGADPDVYSFWHSSQAADPGLNLSAYASTAADRALENGRINSDTDVRAGKYLAFQAAFQADNPAVILYSPAYIYAASDSVHGIINRRPVEPADRFWGIERWTVKTVRAVR